MSAPTGTWFGLTPGQVEHIKEQKGKKKRFPWTKDAFTRATEDALNKRPPPGPRFHLIMLAPPFDTAEKIQELGRSSDTPAVEQAETIPKHGETTTKPPETIRFCRSTDAGYVGMLDWVETHEDQASMVSVHIMYEGNRRAVWRVVFH